MTPHRLPALRFALLTAAALALCLNTLPALGQPTADLLLRGARVVDGSASPARSADVAVLDGRILAVGRNLPHRARTRLDVSGLVLAPGFIDVHTHADEIDAERQAENFLRMGVTTVVIGNCGSSPRDLEGFFRRLAKHPAAINTAALVGHNTIRASVMGGSFMRPPTESEQKDMERQVAAAMEAGALGLSTGLIYLPGTFARTPEISALAGIAAAHGGLYVSHIRDEAAGVLDALQELFSIARNHRMPAHISHIKASTKAVWGRSAEILARIDAARAEGLEITQDQYLYPASSTGISQLIPETAREGGRDRFQQRLAVPAEKVAIVEAMKTAVSQNGHGDYEYARIAFYAKNPALNGLSVREAAQRARGSDRLEDQIELILEIEANGGAQGVFHSMNEDDLQAFLRHPNTMIASDSGIRLFGQGVPHPRGYGNNARLLARYVRDLGLLRLEEAVRRMTSLPAATFGLAARGHIQPGACADIVLFDPARIQDRATFEQPHHYPDGVVHVLVNGTFAIRDGKLTPSRSGHPLRHGHPPSR